MKKFSLLLTFSLGMIVMFFISAYTDKPEAEQEKYILQHEADIKTEQAGPHDGGGNTTAYPFFSKTKDLHFTFRKRVLHPGSAIGYHLQKSDEIYYIMEGRGMMQMNGDSFYVNKGDAVLTRPGSSHGLKPAGNEDVTVLISYAE